MRRKRLARPTKSSKINILWGLRRPDRHSASASFSFISSLNFNPLAALQYLTLY
ncbi:hypothetical protein HMPREF9534_03888 [Escherichia coli MS 69-1]|nr:hypothetical protein HMPREF9534_03888 [Escherichia coli MS 69-1]